MYGIIKNGYVEYSPETIIFENGKCICNPTEEQLMSSGYKLIITDDKPEILPNQYVIESYTENDNEIIIHYQLMTVVVEDNNPIM